MALTNRENYQRAMRRLPCERVPFQFSFTPSQTDELIKRYGSADFVRIFDMPMEYIRLPSGKVNPIYLEKYHKNIDDRTSIDEWGIGHQSGSVAHFSKFISPMADFEDVSEVLEYPFPDVLNPERWKIVKEKVDKAHSENRAAVFMAIQVFEPAWYLRGLENMLMDFMADEEMADACMTKMTDIKCKMAAKAAECDFDMIVFGDDVGSQRALMMSLDVWRRFIKPATYATIKAAKDVNPNVLAMYHSDGVIYDIIPELIEMGVDILNPVQPECVDPVKLKNLYGDRLSFHGTIGTQTVMPFGTPEEVRENVKKMIEIVGKGGGLTIAPTHILEPEVPWANIEAFIQAAKDFGNY